MYLSGGVFRGNSLLSNPIVGLMIGVLFTVLVQSSSTCTSVIVSMVASGILDVPMVMGANIGTSLTSTLVSLTQMTDKLQFERAFAGATIHDCFNWLTVIVLLTLEVSTGYLYKLTLWITDSMDDGTQSESEADLSGSRKKLNLLGAITKPLTKKVIQVSEANLTFGLSEEGHQIYCVVYFISDRQIRVEMLGHRSMSRGKVT